MGWGAGALDETPFTNADARTVSFRGARPGAYLPPRTPAAVSEDNVMVTGGGSPGPCVTRLEVLLDSL